MEPFAIISHLLPYVLAIFAVYLCIALFRQRRAFGWLFLSAVFLEPFLKLIICAFRGRPLLPYRTISVGSDGIMQVSYRMDFPFLSILAVVGLFMLLRESQNKDGESR
jgi:hypothetical protein